MTDYKDEIRERAGLGETLYRVGTPSIGETYGRRYNANRGSGGLGTGVYAFTTREAAESNVSNTSPDKEVFVIRNALVTPIRPADFQTTVALNDTSQEAARVISRVRDGQSTYAEEKENPTSRMRRKARSVLFDTPELRDRYGFDTEQFVGDWIEAAQTADQLQQEATGQTAVQPINLLLYPEFDGVYPRGEAGESGTYGAVIFKERVDACVGRNTERSEEVPAETLNDCFGQRHND